MDDIDECCLRCRKLTTLNKDSLATDVAGITFFVRARLAKRGNGHDVIPKILENSWQI